MDCQPPTEGYLIDIVDNEWRQDQLPKENVKIPCEKLPDPEADNGDTHLTLQEQEQKWPDLGLSELAISDQINISGM